MDLDKYEDQKFPVLERTLFNKSNYMQPIPESDRQVLNDIRRGKPIKKDRLISFIRNSELFAKYLKQLEKEDRKLHREAVLFWDQPLEKIMAGA